jgi:hypothetical protein
MYKRSFSLLPCNFQQTYEQQMNSRFTVKKLCNLTRSECNRRHEMISVPQINVAAPEILTKTKHIFTIGRGHFPDKESKSFRLPECFRTSYISK